MMNDYKDILASQRQYAGISKCMKDLYESCNMDFKFRDDEDAEPAPRKKAEKS